MLTRRSPLRPGRPPRRKTPLRTRRARKRDRGEIEDLPYLAWLRTRPCRVSGTVPSDPHHLRHTATGAPMGARVKDDRRAISLSRAHHNMREREPWRLRELLGVDDLRRWENEQLAAQRAEYERDQAPHLCAEVS